MSTHKPALPATELPTHRSSMYPPHLAARMGDREKRKLGDAFGLTQFGVNMVTLGPGGQSALRHWHSHEDELIYVLSGQVVLVSNDGEQVLRAGSVVGFPGGVANAHHLLNRSDEVAHYLEVGSRIEHDDAFYPDDDLLWQTVDGKAIAAHKDGTPY
jgi:uncharacterized cupin superfamily protein